MYILCIISMRHISFSWQCIHKRYLKHPWLYRSVCFVKKADMLASKSIWVPNELYSLSPTLSLYHASQLSYTTQWDVMRCAHIYKYFPEHPGTALAWSSLRSQGATLCWRFRYGAKPAVKEREREKERERGREKEREKKERERKAA